MKSSSSSKSAALPAEQDEAQRLSVAPLENLREAIAQCLYEIEPLLDPAPGGTIPWAEAKGLHEGLAGRNLDTWRSWSVVADCYSTADAILALPAFKARHEPSDRPDPVDLFEALEEGLCEGSPTISLINGRVWIATDDDGEAAFDARTVLRYLQNPPPLGSERSDEGNAPRDEQ